MTTSPTIRAATGACRKEHNGRGAASSQRPRVSLHLLAPAVALAFLAACTGPQSGPYGDYVQTWVGGPADRLTRVWGPPQHTARLPDGSGLIEYRERSVERVAAPVSGGASAPVGRRLENRVSWCTTRFIVRNNVVQSVNYEGAACRAP